MEGSNGQPRDLVAQPPGEVPAHFTDEQRERILDATHRVRMAGEALKAINATLPGGAQLSLPSDMQQQAAGNAVIQLLIDAGVFTKDEFAVQQHVEFAEMMEGAVQAARRARDKALGPIIPSSAFSGERG